MSKETLLGYVVLLIGVVVGWALCWLWGNMRKRRRKLTNLVKSEIEKSLKAGESYNEFLNKKVEDTIGFPDFEDMK